MTSIDARRLLLVNAFEGLPIDVVERVAQACSWSHIVKGRQILGQDDDSTDLFFVVEGSVQVIGYSGRGKAVSFTDIAAPSMFGEFSAVDGRPRSASVVAISPCRVGRLRATEFRALLLEEPRIMLQVLESTIAKARQLTDRVLEFSVLPADARLHIELLRMADLLSGEDDAGRIEPAPTHQEIAERISSHREAVTRELNRLRGEGVLRHGRGFIDILNGEALRAMIRASNLR